MAADRFEARRQAVVSRLAERKLDCLFVSIGPNLRYLSGFTGSSASLLVAPGGTVLFTDPRYQIQASHEVTCRVKIAKGPPLAGVLAAIRRRGLKRVGFEPGRMMWSSFASLKLGLPPKALLVPAADLVEELRVIKSPEELALIRLSVETNSRAFELAVARCRPGMKEQDLAAELEYRMRRLGAEKPAFDTIVASGARSALPHAQPTAARLNPGDLVVVDMGALREGYCSDMTRMLSIGEPGPKVKRMYRAVLEAQLAAIDSVRAGVLAARVDRIARKVLKKYGLDEAFTHSTGHGLGLEIHESPRIGASAKGRLQAGMAVTVEPGVYLEGFGGIRIEDTVAVTDTGCEVLTPTSKALRIV